MEIRKRQKPLHREPAGWVDFQLSDDELVAIENILRDEEIHREDDFLTATRDLIMKFGWRLAGGNGEMKVHDEELWLLREIIPTSMRTPSNPTMGLELKKRIYRGLLDIEAQWAIEMAKEMTDGIASYNTNQGASEDARKRAKPRKKPKKGDASPTTVPRPEGEDNS